MSGRERIEPGGDFSAVVESDQPVDSPRIVVDGVFFQIQNTGIARVWKALMAEWSQSGFAGNIVILDRCQTAPRLPGFTYRPMVPLHYHDSYLQRVALERVCRAERAALFVSTYYTVPLATPSLLYLYDMIPEVMNFNMKARLWREKRRAIEYASAYIAISENTAHDLERFYPVASSRPVRVAHCAAERLFAPATESQVVALLAELDLPRDYCIFIGARDSAYKNAALILDAVALLRPDRRPALLFVGGSPVLEAELQARVDNKVVRVASLSDEQLPVAYSGARGLLYPSKYEGFGLPILEAMACGCPVITCRNSSIPEVADEAAIYVGEDDAEDLAAAIASLSDPNMKATYRARGLDRARQFDWARTATEVEHFIREMASTPTGWR